MNDNNLELRQELNKIFNPALTDTDIEIQLKKLKGHNISLIQTQSNFINEYSDNFNCVEYALGLYKSDRYKKIRLKLASSYLSGIFCSPSFIEWLIHNQKLNEHPTEGMNIIVIYFKHTSVKHVGIVKDSRKKDSPIISKFGSRHIYEHPANQVPDNYGYPSKYYIKPTLNETEHFFKGYLHEMYGGPLCLDKGVHHTSRSVWIENRDSFFLI